MPKVAEGIVSCSCPGRLGGMEADWYEVGGWVGLEGVWKLREWRRLKPTCRVDWVLLRGQKSQLPQLVKKVAQRTPLQKTPGGYVGDRARKDRTLPSLSLTPRLLSLSKLWHDQYIQHDDEMMLLAGRPNWKRIQKFY